MVNHDTWWIDFSSTIHVFNTLQGGRMSSHVEAIGAYNLILNNLHLWVFPLISWTLILLYPIKLKLLVLVHYWMVFMKLNYKILLIILCMLSLDCIKKKQSNKSKRSAKRSTNILEIIHIDICCPNMDMIIHDICISTYFVLRMKLWMHLNFLRLKWRSNMKKQIKIVRFDRGEKYYGRYIENGQALGPFVNFVQGHEIVAQYTMFGSLD
ncbi:hypothetical protein CR513_37289, partial [Mucuna pruriens]